MSRGGEGDLSLASSSPIIIDVEIARANIVRMIAYLLLLHNPDVDDPVKIYDKAEELFDNDIFPRLVSFSRQEKFLDPNEAIKVLEEIQNYNNDEALRRLDEDKLKELIEKAKEAFLVYLKRNAEARIEFHKGYEYRRMYRNTQLMIVQIEQLREQVREEIGKIWEEIGKIWKEVRKIWEEIGKMLKEVREKVSKEVGKIREEVGKICNEMDAKSRVIAANIKDLWHRVTGK